MTACSCPCCGTRLSSVYAVRGKYTVNSKADTPREWWCAQCDYRRIMTTTERASRFESTTPSLKGKATP
jgi:hypothetical protein